MLAFVTPVCPGETEGRRRSKGTPRAVFAGERCRRARGGEIRGVSRAGQPSRESTGPTPSALALHAKCRQVGTIRFLPPRSFCRKLPLSYRMRACAPMGMQEPTACTHLHRHGYAHVCTRAQAHHTHMHTCMCTQVELRLPTALQRGRGRVVVTHSGQVPWTGLRPCV